MEIHESAEDYLEMILILKERLGLVRSIDIVHEMNYAKPSVSVAMKRLRENGYIEMDKEGYIALLPPGLEIAQRIYTRHRLLSKFLEYLGVSRETASAGMPVRSSMTSVQSPLRGLCIFQSTGIISGSEAET